MAGYHEGEETVKKAISEADYIYKGMIVPKEEMKMKETVKIEGMMCGHCAVSYTHLSAAFHSAHLSFSFCMTFMPNALPSSVVWETPSILTHIS